MKPLQQYHRQSANGMSFRKDVILDVLSQNPCRVQDLMDICMHINLASQATIHREIHEMVKSKFISYKVNKLDNRIANLKITPSGKKYLEKL